MAAADQGVDVLISWGREVHPPVPTHEEEGRKEERKKEKKRKRVTEERRRKKKYKGRC